MSPNNKRLGMKKRIDFVVVLPRYTPGEPHMVELLAGRIVARKEDIEYRHCLNGKRGKEAQARAERLGNAGIVEHRIEHAHGNKRGWNVHDLVTGEKYWKMCTGSRGGA